MGRHVAGPLFAGPGGEVHRVLVPDAPRGATWGRPSDRTLEIQYSLTVSKTCRPCAHGMGPTPSSPKRESTSVVGSVVVMLLKTSGVGGTHRRPDGGTTRPTSTRVTNREMTIAMRGMTGDRPGIRGGSTEPGRASASSLSAIAFPLTRSGESALGPARLGSGPTPNTPRKDVTVTSDPLCYSYWDNVPLTAEEQKRCSPRWGSHDVAHMIGSKSNTPLAVRRAAHGWRYGP
jgi:hypothetical protein